MYNFSFSPLIFQFQWRFFTRILHESRFCFLHESGRSVEPLDCGVAAKALLPDVPCVGDEFVLA